MAVTNKDNCVLLVFMEPTSYILALVNALRAIWIGELDVMYIKENFTQEWNLTLATNDHILPKSPIKAFLKIFHLVRAKKHQLFFLAGWGHWACLQFIIFARFFKTPVVVDSDTQLPEKLTLWKSVAKCIFYPFLFKLISAFLPGGKRQAKYLQFYGVKDSKIFIEQMTVDVTAIQTYTATMGLEERNQLRMHLGFKENAVVFLFVGRLVEWKGVKDLIEAFIKLDNSTAKLLFIGDGPIKNYVEGVVAARTNIHYAGRVTDMQLINYYHMADVLVLPSHAEPWGLVVNEAMAVGLPVIVSKQVGCVEDLVFNEQTGLIIEPKNIDALCEAMRFLCEYPLVRKKMSKNALALIKNWTLENEAKNICAVWKKLICT